MIYDNTYLNYYLRGRATLEVAKNRTRPLPVADKGRVRFCEKQVERAKAKKRADFEQSMKPFPCTPTHLATLWLADAAVQGSYFTSRLYYI